MAVEDGHHNILQHQLLANRDMRNPIRDNSQMGLDIQVPYSVINNTIDKFHPPSYYNNSVPHAPLKNNTAVKSDNSGVTYDISSASRKRSRDHQSMTNPFVNATYNMPCNSQVQQHHQNHATSSLSFFGEDMSSFVQSQHLHIERLISQHMEKVRYEIEENRKLQTRKIIETVQMDMMKRMKVKEDEIQKIGKLNWALEERVKTLCMENQIWRDLAQSNEATANALRNNLQHVLAQVMDTENDAQSCCGSSGNNVLEGRTWPDADDSYKVVVDSKRLCKNCLKVESCVLLLPCRHLCLCTNCVSSLHVCPVCTSVKNASVHVNMS